jgi:serine/threonine-protein kinase RsbW
MSVDATKEFQIVVTNKLENLPAIAKFISDALQQLGMQEEKIFDVNVAVDEACTNIIQNGYSPDEVGTIEIRCEALNGNKCAVLIKDHGKAFDQTQAVPVDTTSSLEERKPGGLGLFFIRELVDEIYYEYKGGYETLTMVKSMS